MQTQLSAKCMSKSFKHPIDYFILGFYATISNEKRKEEKSRKLSRKIYGRICQVKADERN